MGGGDLNLKKSWHPLLHSNQERVWLAERAAIDEKKRLKELEKERKEERELQELRRLGGKVEERVDWLYATPAQGSGPSVEEQEAYLLGKKRVDQLFKEQDEKRLAALRASNAPGAGKEEASAVGGGAINQFQALGQNANNARDLAAKVREDPILAIKKQELAHLEALRKDPSRLRALTAQKDIDKAARKEERRKKREEKEARRDARGRSRSRSPVRRRSDDYDYDRHRASYHRERSPRRRSDSRSPPHHSVKREDSPPPRRSVKREKSPPPRDSRRYDYDDSHRSVKRESRSPEPYRRPRSPPSSRPRSNGYTNGGGRPTGALPADPEAAARLAAMTASAAKLSADRQARLSASDAAEAEALKREEADRQRTAKIGDGAARFVRAENARASELGLGDRLRGARAAGMRVDRD